MQYYEILAGSQRYHGTKPLVYACEKSLAIGSIVTIPLQNQNISGIVLSEVTKPPFLTKSIIQLLPIPALPGTSLELINWLSQYYPAPIGSIVSNFIPHLFGPRLKIPTPITPSTVRSKVSLPPLTKEQKAVTKEIHSSKYKLSFLLHGDTGTGKTRIYIEQAGPELAKGRSVLILTPEISLSSQLISEFKKSFSYPVIAFHSNLSEAKRRGAWLQILGSIEPVIVVGPRSALFAPFKKLGLIVVDEAHESAYKQEQTPRYHALRVAGKLAQLHKAKLIIGTATPNVTDYYIAETIKMPILRMQELATKSLPARIKTKVVPSNDKTLFSRNPYLSDDLLNAVETSLNKNEQSLVYLNRRGTARLILCEKCGWQALCPNCDLPLTYHGDIHIMRCHTCGYKAKAVANCSVCGSSKVLYKSIGTKSIVDSLARLFPKARIQRFDTDNKQGERFEQHYDTIVRGDVDILVGTQLLAKGLDLPRLGMVGVVTADTGLSFPDYTAEEHTYQQLLQIVGRVGRGHTTGTAIIQTHNPNSPAIISAINKDWDSFYKAQLDERRQFMFPPFCYLLKLGCTRKTQASAIKTSQALMHKIQRLPLKLQLSGPAPSFYEKSSRGFKWQIIIKAKNRNELLKIVQILPAGWAYDLDPISLL